MLESDKYLLPLKEIEAEKSSFRIKKPSKKKWILIISIFVLFNVLIYLTIRYIPWDVNPSKGENRLLIILILSVSLVTPVISVFAWHWVSKFVVKKLVTKTIKIKHVKKLELEEIFGQIKTDREYKKYKFFRVFISMLFNINIEPETKYYLEEEALDLNVGSIREFIQKRMYEMITSTLGIGYVAAVIKNYSRPGSLFIGFMIGFLAILASTILIAWVTPVIWTVRDARIMLIRKNNENHLLAERMRRSIISRLFSVSAFFAGISFIMDVFESNGMFSKSEGIIHYLLMFIAATGALLLIIVLISGSLFLIGSIYLSVFHEKHVNNLRDELSEIIKYAQTNAILSEHYST